MTLLCQVRSKAFFFSLMFFGCLSSCGKLDDSKGMVEVHPSTVQRVSEDIVNQNPRLADLAVIAIALEKYKQDHRSYPLSSGAVSHWIDKKWDSIIDKNGEHNPNWIEGLVPEYLPSLPVDPRKDAVATHQYSYKSNGANYKLVVLNPDDCVSVKLAAPEFVDHRLGKCNAYGFWTPRALKWH